MLKQVEKEINFLEKIQKKNVEAIKAAPEGKLRCAINKGCYQYYLGKKYLGGDKKEFIKQLAQKEYCLKLNESIEKYIEKLKELLAMYNEERLLEAFRCLHPARKCLVEPFIKPVEDIVKEFDHMEYEGKEFSEEDRTTYYTMKGERVRSKSEKIIADEFFRQGIPYKYERPIELQMNRRKVTFYPDFTVLNKRTGKLWIVEHLGMMDKAFYFENAMQKLEAYERNDILLGDSLLLLHETSNYPLNTNVLKKYIERYLN